MHTSVPAPFGELGDAHLSVHAQSEKWDRTNQHGLARRERLGQCNFGIPRPLMNTCWQHVQGGVVNRCREQGQRDFGCWDQGVTGCVSCDSYSVSYQKVFICMYRK